MEKKQMCNKKKYNDKLSAMIALANCLSLGKNKNKNRLETRYYWCNICNAYHLTKQPIKNKI